VKQVRRHCHPFWHWWSPAWSYFHEPFGTHRYIRTCRNCGRKETLVEHPLEWVRVVDHPHRKETAV
jgi:hypothetical protein